MKHPKIYEQWKSECDKFPNLKKAYYVQFSYLFFKNKLYLEFPYNLFGNYIPVQLNKFNKVCFWKIMHGHIDCQNKESG